MPLTWHALPWTVSPDLVPALRVAERHGGQVAEHALADREKRGVGFVVRLAAVDEADAVERAAVQVVEIGVVLGARLLIGAGLRQHVDRGAGDQVLVILVGGGKGIAEFLAHQHRGTLDGEAAALVAVVEHIGAILRQHVGPADGAQAKQPPRPASALADAAASSRTGCPGVAHGPRGASCSRSRRRRYRWRRGRLRALRTRDRGSRSRSDCDRTT